MTAYMFIRVGLEMNFDNTKAMFFTTDFILGQIGEVDFRQISTVEGTKFFKRKSTRVSCS